MDPQLLGGLAPRTFLRRHWQKRPLFVRGAIPAFRGVIDLDALRALAARDDVESRFVVQRGRRLETRHGPFKSLGLSKRCCTLLVSGVNLHVAAADRLLRRFAFLPQARLDDVMVSYALPGGGVGPHVDSYDVFLLQGGGRRRWTVWDDRGRPFGEWTCEAGDLLYLPPGWKHDGVALDACYTYSIGFRAPRGAELAAALLDLLNERGLPDAAYRDPGLRPVRRPAEIPQDMLRFCEQVLGRIRWGRREAAEVLGRFLTEPKPHVVFRRSASKGTIVALDPRSQLLYKDELFFMNGERLVVQKRHAGLLRELADRRAIARRRLAGTPLAGLISDWLRSGYVRLQAVQP